MATENNKFIQMVGGEKGTDKKTQKMLTTALVSKILGRNEDAVSDAVKKKEEQIFGNPGPFFNTQGSARVAPLKTKDSVTDILGKMYNFRRIKHDKELLDSEIRHNMEMAQRRDQEKQQNKLLQMFTDKTVTGKGAGGKETAYSVERPSGRSTFAPPKKRKDKSLLGEAWDMVKNFVPSILGSTFMYNAEKYKGQEDYQGKVYNSFVNAGFSEKQSLALTAEVGRENNYNPDFLFGQHVDAASKNQNREIVNIGMISFNDSRRNELIKYMRSKGLIAKENGKNVEFVRGQESLDAQAEFIKREMETNPAYSRTKKNFLANPDIGREEGAEILGTDYIRWDYHGKYVLGREGAERHSMRRRSYYEHMEQRVEKQKREKEEPKPVTKAEPVPKKQESKPEEKKSKTQPVDKSQPKTEPNKDTKTSETKPTTTPVASVKPSANIERIPSAKEGAVQVGSKENERMKDEGGTVVVNQVAMLNNTTVVSGGENTTMVVPQAKSDKATLLDRQYG